MQLESAKGQISNLSKNVGNEMIKKCCMKLMKEHINAEIRSVEHKEHQFLTYAMLCLEV